MITSLLHRGGQGPAPQACTAALSTSCCVTLSWALTLSGPPACLPPGKIRQRTVSKHRLGLSKSALSHPSADSFDPSLPLCVFLGLTTLCSQKATRCLCRCPDPPAHAASTHTGPGLGLGGQHHPSAPEPSWPGRPQHVPNQRGQLGPVASKGGLQVPPTSDDDRNNHHDKRGDSRAHPPPQARCKVLHGLILLRTTSALQTGQPRPARSRPAPHHAWSPEPLGITRVSQKWATTLPWIHPSLSGSSTRHSLPNRAAANIECPLADALIHLHYAWHRAEPVSEAWRCHSRPCPCWLHCLLPPFRGHLCVRLLTRLRVAHSSRPGLHLVPRLGLRLHSLAVGLWAHY